MSTHSKVADRIRSDSIVIRLNDAADALSVIDYINNDIELISSSKKTNPFLFRHGIVGIAYDDMLSYNSTVALMLEQYFKECRKKKTFDKVSLEHFREFANKFYNTVFKNPNKLIEFLNYPGVDVSYRFYCDTGAMLVNYEQVIRLIIESLNPKMTLEQYLSFYKKCLNEKNNQNIIDYYNQFLINSFGSKRSPLFQRLFPQKLKLPNEQQSYPTNKDIELLNSYIEFAAQKYGHEKVVEYLLNYKNNRRAITRTNNFRNRFIANLPYDMILQITNNDILGYVQQHLRSKNIINDSPIKYSNEDYKLFLEACIATYNKYGSNQLVDAISNAALGDYGYFTGENYRNNMRKRNLAPQINNFCNLVIEQYGVTTTSNNLYADCADSIIILAEQQRKNHQQEKNVNPNTENYNIFIEACIATYNKYGYEQLVEAISNAVSGDYGYFTGQNYRDNLCQRNLKTQINTFCQILIEENEIAAASDSLYENGAKAIISIIELRNQISQERIY